MVHPDEIISLLDPTGEAESQPKRPLAPRLSSLKGALVGFLSNQKPNVNPLLDELGQILMNEYKVDRIVTEFKLSQTQPADDKTINTLSECDAIVHGVAD